MIFNDGVGVEMTTLVYLSKYKASVFYILAIPLVKIKLLAHTCKNAFVSYSLKHYSNTEIFRNNLNVFQKNYG